MEIATAVKTTLTDRAFFESIEFADEGSGTAVARVDINPDTPTAAQENAAPYAAQTNKENFWEEYVRESLERARELAKQGKRVTCLTDLTPSKQEPFCPWLMREQEYGLLESADTAYALDAQDRQQLRRWQAAKLRQIRAEWDLDGVIAPDEDGKDSEDGLDPDKDSLNGDEDSLDEDEDSEDGLDPDKDSLNGDEDSLDEDEDSEDESDSDEDSEDESPWSTEARQVFKRHGYRVVAQNWTAEVGGNLGAPGIVCFLGESDLGMFAVLAYTYNTNYLPIVDPQRATRPNLIGKVNSSRVIEIFEENFEPDLEEDIARDLFDKRGRWRWSP